MGAQGRQKGMVAEDSGFRINWKWVDILALLFPCHTILTKLISHSTLLP